MRRIVGKRCDDEGIHIVRTDTRRACRVVAEDIEIGYTEKLNWRIPVNRERKRVVAGTHNLKEVVLVHAGIVVVAVNVDIRAVGLKGEIA
ncbi:MAG TPA: hypothetical protein PKI05_11290, partial [Thermogutta sp.]|nr:hypothetical protein [Thermogutta sp.]